MNNPCDIAIEDIMLSEKKEKKRRNVLSKCVMVLLAIEKIWNNSWGQLNIFVFSKRIPNGVDFRFCCLWWDDEMMRKIFGASGPFERPTVGHQRHQTLRWTFFLFKTIFLHGNLFFLYLCKHLPTSHFFHSVEWLQNERTRGTLRTYIYEFNMTNQNVP